MCYIVSLFQSGRSRPKNYVLHLTLKSRSKVKFKVISGFLYVFYSNFLSICNIKAKKLHFDHLTLKSRSTVKFNVTYLKVIPYLLYVFYSNICPISNILQNIHKKTLLIKIIHAERYHIK